MCLVKLYAHFLNGNVSRSLAMEAINSVNADSRVVVNNLVKEKELALA
jgi:hypothetical protein